MVQAFRHPASNVPHCGFQAEHCILMKYLKRKSIVIVLPFTSTLKNLHCHLLPHTYNQYTHKHIAHHCIVNITTTLYVYYEPITHLGHVVDIMHGTGWLPAGRTHQAMDGEEGIDSMFRRTLECIVIRCQLS